MKNRYDHVLWIDASNRYTLEQSYKDIALKIGILSNKSCSLGEALRELEFYRGRWLLLFDGADDLEEISDLFPPGIHGDVVYTSKDKMLRRLPTSQMRCVSGLNDEEAPELLLKSARLNASSKGYQEQALAIVKELGYLALAIDQAGAYMARGECRLDDFLDIFNVHRHYLLQNEAYRGASGSDRAVYATWDLSYTAIARQADATVNEPLRQGPKAALQILQVFPFLHNEGIMEDIFRFAAENYQSQPETECETNGQFPSALLRLRPDGGWESQSFRQGIRMLLSYSLITQESSQRQFSMHRLVHLWAYDRLTTIEKDQFGNQAQNILMKSITWRFNTTDYTFRRNLLPHITKFQRQTNLTSVTQKKEGMAKFALIFWEAGRWKEAEELDVQVMELCKKVLGEEHPHTLNSIGNLASTYRNQGRWKEAEELGVQVMELRKKVLGEEHPHTSLSMNNLAFTWRGQGRNAEAIKLMEECVYLRTRILGVDHPKTLSSSAELIEWQREDATDSSFASDEDNEEHGA